MSVLESVFLFGSAPEGWLEGVLPEMNWRGHVFVTGDPWEATQAATDHVERHAFATLYVHAVDPPDDLLEVAHRFQAEAYRLQSDARLIISPILDEPPSAERIEHYQSQAVTPSFFCAEADPMAGARLYVGEELPGHLCCDHVFSSVLDKVDDGDVLGPCKPHRVADGGVFQCAALWRDRDAGPVQPERCAGCIGRSVLAMKRDVIANGRSEEGRQVFLAVASALAARGEHRLAADLAHAVRDLGPSGEELGGALLCEGMSLLAIDELPPAEEALEAATRCPIDQGYVAWQRGQAQFAWRDWIEAQERYEEVLEIGTPEVPAEHVRYQLALCHVNLEEYPEARAHLAHCSRSAPVAFYDGVCVLGQGDPQAALALFDEALAAGPSDEDLGRVLFYKGSCYKEQERYPEAIAVLRQALDADPDDIANPNLLGFCYYKTGRHEEAIECFRRCLEIDPRSAIDWANLGSNLRDTGRVDDAILVYKKALSLDPSLGWAKVNLLKLME